MRLASWCNRSAADTTRSGPCVPANIPATGREGELILGPPYIPSYGGHEGGFHTPDPNRHGCLSRRTMSCGIGIPACCSEPAVTAPVRVWPHTHRRVPPLSNPDRCPKHLDTLLLRWTPLSLPPQTPSPDPFVGHFPYWSRSSYRPGSAASSV